MTIISSQKGASIIAVIAIMLILAVMGAALVSLVTTGSDVSVNQLQSEQAFNVAEGGLEKALTEFINTGTSCASLTYTNSLGAGSFTTTPTLNTASVLLAANIIATDMIIPVNSTAGYASHGRIRIENEDINYAATSTSCAPFVSPACFTGAQRGVAGSTAAIHNTGATVFVAQEECLIRSTGTVTNSSAQRIVEKGIQMPGAMMVYAKLAGDNIPYYRRWDGTQWGPERQATAVGAGFTIQYMVLKFARTRNEAVLGTLDSNGDIRVQVWDGNTQTWSATTLLANIGTTNDAYRGFDIEYETNGDRAIVVYNTNVANQVSYRIWDGLAWTAAANQTLATLSIGVPYWIELAPYPLLDSSPRNNEIAMIVLGSNVDVYGLRWTGAAWNNMFDAVRWDTTAATATRKAIDVAYEQLTGRAMFIWGDSVVDDQYYRIWDGISLTGNTLLRFVPAVMGGVANWVRLAPDPTSNRIMYGVQDAGIDLNTRLWSGAAWDGNPPHAEHDAGTENANDRNFDIVFETNPANAGMAWLIWGNGGNTSRKQWNSGTNSWGLETTFGDDAALVQLMAHPRTGTIFTGIYQSTGSGTFDITALQNVGGAWSAETQIWNGGITSNLYERVFIAAERYVPIINWREIYP